MVEPRSPRRILFRLWAVILLAMIGLQAAGPVRAPLERVTGSAFSAATADVALVSARRAEAAQATAFPAPLPPKPWAVVAAGPAVALDFAEDAQRLRPEARGPPPRVRSERLPDLRGPPLA